MMLIKITRQTYIAGQIVYVGEKHEVSKALGRKLIVECGKAVEAVPAAPDKIKPAQTAEQKAETSSRVIKAGRESAKNK